MFRKVLIANRGEIAVRIAQTLQEMGIAAVAVYSEADRRSRHVARADEAFQLDGVTAAETYLDVHQLLEAAAHHGVDAIHPGYGFLSENADFARACAEAGYAFIGPRPEVIAAMGDKIVAKRTLADAGIPMIPGWSGAADASLAEIRKAADEIGYPILLKAAAGGGGKGMRIVREGGEMESAVGAAQREASSAFGDARVFLEKYIERPRHVEFQIFGDAHGNVQHLFERECSIQRRYQKIVEETPSPALSPELRERMGAAAVRAAALLKYTNAGTIEFLVDEGGEFYFLEVNTRLQVEHPITELVVDEDLVRAQVLVAAGEPLPFSGETVRQHGHAIEVRVYAEDPVRGFLPSTGTIVRYHEPHGRCIRVDSGVGAGTHIGVHYDPMLAKLIVWGHDREEARRRLLWALDRYVVIGVTTNIGFLRQVVAHPAFVAGETHTHFLDEHAIAGAPIDDHEADAALIAAAFAMKQGVLGRNSAAGRESAEVPPQGPWTSQQALEERLMFRVWLQHEQSEAAEVSLERISLAQLESHHAHIDGRHIEVEMESMQPGAGWMRIGGRVYPFIVAERDGELCVWLKGRTHTIRRVDRTPRRASGGAAAAQRNELTAPMPGRVLKTLIEPGDEFEAHQPLIVIESMKMEMTISAPHAGRVESISCAAGALVEMGAVLATLDYPDAE